MNINVLINDELWDPNIFTHLIYPKYLDAQAAYWTNLSRFNKNSRRLIRLVPFINSSDSSDSFWFDLSIKNRTNILRDVIAFGSLNYCGIDKTLDWDNL